MNEELEYKAFGDGWQAGYATGSVSLKEHEKELYSNGFTMGVGCGSIGIIVVYMVVRTIYTIVMAYFNKDTSTPIPNNQLKNE